MKRVLFLLLIAKITFSVNAQNYKLGILTDYQRSAKLDSICHNMIEEINKTTGPERTFTLDVMQGISPGVSSPKDAALKYDKLADNSDYIILVGANAVKGTLDNNYFPVPTIGIGFIDPNMQDLPLENGKSGVTNFSYIWASKSIEKELDIFQEIVPFNNLTILVDEYTSSSFNQDKGVAYLNSLEEKLSIEINTLTIGNDILQSFSNINPETDAVYIPNLQNIDTDGIETIAEVLKIKKLPSFSSQKQHVEHGIMASISDKNDFKQVVKKLAMMVDESLYTTPLSNINVHINLNEDLFINTQAANELGIPLSFEVLFTANFINESKSLSTYSIDDVLEIALKNNLGIKMSHQDVSLAIQDAKLAKSAILPQLGLGINGRQINEEMAFVLFDNPVRRVAGQLTLDQVIYSEEVMAGIKIAHYMQKAQEYNTEAQILQIYLNTYLDYLTVLAAKTALHIESENLENLKINLELARIRMSSGDAGNAEILRWESEVAAATQRVVETNIDFDNSKLRLNTTLANSLEDDFDIKDITINDNLYKHFNEGIFSQLVDQPNDIVTISQFLVQESVSKNPNKRALLEQINAVKRKNTQNKRLLYTPNVALQAQMNQVIARGGKGSNTADFNIPNNTWNVGVGVSFPIFAGNSRRINIKSTKIQMDQMNHTRLQLDQELELAVRSNLSNTFATSTNIDFSKVSANNAAANFELVRDQYQAGEVNITQVIDAQQSSLNAKMRHALAIYEYVQSQLQLEYSVGFFSSLATEEQLNQFNTRFQQFITK